MRRLIWSLAAFILLVTTFQSAWALIFGFSPDRYCINAAGNLAVPGELTVTNNITSLGWLNSLGVNTTTLNVSGKSYFYDDISIADLFISGHITDGLGHNTTAKQLQYAYNMTSNGTLIQNGSSVTLNHLIMNGLLNMNNNKILGSDMVIGWQNLTNYPSACSNGNAVTQIGDTIICTAFLQNDSHAQLDWLNVSHGGNMTVDYVFIKDAYTTILDTTNATMNFLETNYSEITHWFKVSNGDVVSNVVSGQAHAHGWAAGYNSVINNTFLIKYFNEPCYWPDYCEGWDIDRPSSSFNPDGKVDVSDLAAWGLLHYIPFVIGVNSRVKSPRAYAIGDSNDVSGVHSVVIGSLLNSNESLMTKIGYNQTFVKANNTEVFIKGNTRLLNNLSVMGDLTLEGTLDMGSTSSFTAGQINTLRVNASSYLNTTVLQASGKFLGPNFNIGRGNISDMIYGNTTGEIFGAVNNNSFYPYSSNPSDYIANDSHAQLDWLNVSHGGNITLDRVYSAGVHTDRVDASSYVNTTTLRVGRTILADGNTGSAPVEGAGTRLMWVPEKASLRAGSVNGPQWDDANIGYYSFATGSSTKASGNYASAFGASSATGSAASSFG